PLDVTAALNLAVAPDVVLATGTGTLALAASTNPDGSSASAGVLSIGPGAEVVSENSGLDAITLRGANVNIATGAHPAVVGAYLHQFNPTPTTLSGISAPGAIAFDSAGNLYTIDSMGTTASVFAPN